MNNETSRARPHHYLFAHWLLPYLFHSEPQKFMELLEQDGNNFLRFYWDKVGKDVEQPDRLSFVGVDFLIETFNTDVKVGVITLPKPSGVTEAFFVAAIYQSATTTQASIARFFTLEHGENLDGTSRTVLCEWTAEKSHLNYGDGPAPNVNEFLDVVRQKIIS